MLIISSKLRFITELHTAAAIPCCIYPAYVYTSRSSQQIENDKMKLKKLGHLSKSRTEWFGAQGIDCNLYTGKKRVESFWNHCVIEQ